MTSTTGLWRRPILHFKFDRALGKKKAPLVAGLDSSWLYLPTSSRLPPCGWNKKIKIKVKAID